MTRITDKAIIEEILRQGINTDEITSADIERVYYQLKEVSVHEKALKSASYWEGRGIQWRPRGLSQQRLDRIKEWLDRCKDAE